MAADPYIMANNAQKDKEENPVSDISFAMSQLDLNKIKTEHQEDLLEKLSRENYLHSKESALAILDQLSEWIDFNRARRE